MNLVNLKCTNYTVDWFHDKELTIDIDKYIFFEVEYRGGENSWYLIGHKYNKDKDKWETEDFDYHICSIYSMARFIAETNSVPDKHGFLRNRVSRFNNLHYSKDFYKQLSKLLELVEKYTSEIKNKEETENVNSRTK